MRRSIVPRHPTQRSPGPPLSGRPLHAWSGRPRRFRPAARDGREVLASYGLPVTCVFCGRSGGASGEHVIPTWLGPVLVRSQAPTGVRPGGKPITHRFTPPEADGGRPREWSTDAPALVTKAVCTVCNNGWLSDLETAVAPVLTPLVVGQPYELSSDEQRLVATWIYKTVLLFQMVRRGSIRAIPPARFAELHVNRRPPADARVWLSATHGGNAVHETSTEVELSAPTAQAPGFFTALALGNLLALCAGRRVDGPERLRVGSQGHTPSLVSVWPASVRPVNWPPRVPLTDLDARALAQLL